MWCTPSLLLLGTLILGCHGGLLGKYYDGDIGMNIDQPWAGSYHYRIDPEINFMWGQEGPRILKDRFSVVWEGTITIDASLKQLILDSDDGAQVWVDGDLVLSNHDDPYDRFPKVWPSSTDPPLTTGKKPIVIKYYEHYENAHIVLRYNTQLWNEAKWTQWDQAGRNLDQFRVVPDSWLEPAKDPTGAEAHKVQPVTQATVGDWLPLAKIGPKLKVSPEMWLTGYGVGVDTASEYIHKCGDFRLLGTEKYNNEIPVGDKVVMRLTMGDVVDYFRPRENKTLCEMLQTNKYHEWAPDEEGPWFTHPELEYFRWNLGGSKDWWPHYHMFEDRRKYLSFWGGSSAGGCCAEGYSNTKDAAKWARPFSVDVRSHLRLPFPVIHPEVNGWITYAQVPGGVSLVRDTYVKGWQTQLVAAKSAFIGACGNWDAWEDDVVMKITTGEMETYFRPIQGGNLCSMLTNVNQHEWSATGVADEFVIPLYHTDEKLCGGSSWDWPKNYGTGVVKDWGMHHLPLWCGSKGAYSATKKGEQTAWSKTFKMEIKQQTFPPIPDGGDLPASGDVMHMLHLGASLDDRVEVPDTKWKWQVLDLIGDAHCEAGQHFHSGFCWQRFDEKKTREEAQAACTGAGMALASLHSKAEGAMLTQAGFTNSWVDGTDEAKDGTWVNDDGTPFSEEFWGKREPNGKDRENCAWVGWNAMMNDLSCASKQGYICKKSVQGTGEAEMRPKSGDVISNIPRATQTDMTWTKVRNIQVPVEWGVGKYDKAVQFYAVAIESKKQTVKYKLWSDDTVRVYVDGKIDAEVTSCCKWQEFTTDLNGKHQFVFKLREGTGNNKLMVRFVTEGLKWSWSV